MFEKPFNLIVYVTVAALLCVGIAVGTNITVYFALGLFLIWDVYYGISGASTYGRSIASLFSAIGGSRQQVSYFFSFYGVLFGILFALDPSKQATFIQFLNKAEIPVAFLIVPFILGSLGTLFVPIQAGRTRAPNSATPALLALFVVASFCQKATIFIFVHTILRLLVVVISDP